MARFDTVNRGHQPIPRGYNTATSRKALFAFAACNAGPNLWFRNVEYVAAEKTGAETVTCVANICKCYIAYRLITEGLKEKKRDADRLKSVID